jgi:hypothetical protein
MSSQFISSIETVNSGGCCMVDLVHLRDGQIIGVTDDCAVLYPNEAALWSETEAVGEFPWLDLAQQVNPDMYEILKRIPDADKPGTFVVRLTPEYTVDLLTLDDGKVLGIDGATLCLYADAEAVFSGKPDAVIQCIDLKIEAPTRSPS